MKKLIATALLTLSVASPAQAQSVVYNDTPMTWQTPSGCHAGVRFASTKKWDNFACMRVEVSTVDGQSHNIRFATETGSITYITSTERPTVVYGVGFVGPGGTVIVPARGDCKITTAGFVSCGAIAENAVGVTHVASFLNGFTELSAILR